MNDEAKVSPDVFDPQVLENLVQGSLVFLVALNAVAFLFFFFSLYQENIHKLERFFPRIRFPIFIPQFKWNASGKPKKLKKTAEASLEDPKVAESAEPDELAPPPETTAPSIENAPPPPPVENTDDTELPSPEAFDGPTEVIAEAPPPSELPEPEPEVSAESEQPVTEAIADAPTDIVTDEVTDEVTEVMESEPPAEVSEEIVDEVVEEIAEEIVEEPPMPKVAASTPGEILDDSAETADDELAAMVTAAAEAAAEVENAAPEKEVVEEVIEEVAEEVIEEVIEEVFEEVAAADSSLNSDVPEEIVETTEVIERPEIKKFKEDEDEKTEIIVKSDLENTAQTQKIRLDDDLESALNAPLNATEEIPIFDVSALDEQIEQGSQYNS